MADMSYYIVNNIGKSFGGVEVKKRFSELLENKPEEKRTPEEIINNIREKLKGVNDESI